MVDYSYLLSDMNHLYNYMKHIFHLMKILFFVLFLYVSLSVWKRLAL